MTDLHQEIKVAELVKLFLKTALNVAYESNNSKIQ